MIKEALLIVVFPIIPSPNLNFVIKENMNKNENLYVMNVLYTVAYIPNSISVIKKKKDSSNDSSMLCFFSRYHGCYFIYIKVDHANPPHPIADQDYTMDKH